MTGLDHSKINARDRVARRGADNIRDMSIPCGLSRPKLRKGKAAIRAEAEKAIASITRLLKCPCGHSGRVAVTPAMAGRRFRCSKCGEAIE